MIFQFKKIVKKKNHIILESKIKSLVFLKLTFRTVKTDTRGSFVFISVKFIHSQFNIIVSTSVEQEKISEKLFKSTRTPLRDSEPEHLKFDLGICMVLEPR